MARLYYSVYAFIMRSPSRDLAHETTAMFMALMVVLHLWPIATIAALASGYSMTSALWKWLLGGVFVILSIISLYIFVGKRKGAAIVESLGGNKDQRFVAAFGAAVICETLFLPVWFGLSMRWLLR